MRRSDRKQSCRGYSWSSPLKVLGCKIGSSGCAMDDFEEASAAVYRRLWAGAKSRAASKLPLFLKLKEVSRVCWPSVGYRCSWWPLSETMLSEIGALQNAVVACLIRLPRDPFEETEEYCRRRAREARRVVGQSSCWMRQAANRVISWEDHMQRAHTWTWATEVRECRDSLWLQSRRMINNSASAFAGILLSRPERGRPRVRWEEGLLVARAAIA